MRKRHGGGLRKDRHTLAAEGGNVWIQMAGKTVKAVWPSPQPSPGGRTVGWVEPAIPITPDSMGIASLNPSYQPYGRPSPASPIAARPKGER
ncbi:hypothetical protein FQZ97_1269180 [compost metagenome]